MRSTPIKLFLRPATAAVVFVLLTGCIHSANYYMKKGDQLFARGEFAAASLNYRKAVQKRPDDGQAHYSAALAELKLNKGADAFQDLSEAVRLNPNHQGARSELENLALTSYLSDQQRPKVLYDTLVRLSDQWLRENPQSPEGLRIKGYLAMVERRPDEAVDLLGRAHQSNPKELKIALGLMDALAQSKQPEASEKVGLEFIANDPKAGQVYDALYRLYESSNRASDAENILVRKAKENSSEGAFLLQLAGHYARTGKKSEMAAALRGFLANPGSDPRVHLEAGDFYAAAGDWNNALDQYNAGASASATEKALYQNRIARALIAQHRREEGLKVLNAVIAKNPDDKEAHSLRAGLLLGQGAAGKPNEGIQEFQALVDKNPDDVLLRFVLSKAQLESGNVAGARMQLLEVVKRNPRFFDAQVTLSVMAFKQGNMPEALRRSEAAIEVNPDSLQAQLVRGAALVRLGNLDEATLALGRLARQAPNSPDVHLEIALMEAKQKRFAAAEAEFDKVRSLKPDDLQALAGLVNVDLAENRSGKAFERLAEELKRTHGAPAVRYILAMTALRTGKYDTAIGSLRELADQTPGSIEPLLQLADVYRLRGDIDNAVAALRKAESMAPKDTRPPARLTFLLEKENNKEEAKALARRSLSRQPDDAGAMNNLAFLLAETGDDLNEALRLARKAVGKSPNEPYFADTLGFIYLKRNQADQALDIYDNLVRKHPDDPTFAFHMGMAWYQKGERAKAKVVLAHALKLRPPKDIEVGVNDLLSRID